MRRAFGILVVVVLALTGASAAHADAPVIPDTPDLPWTHPTHESPLEVLASGIASDIAQRPVRVVCDSQAEWDALNLPGAWGYVPPPRAWNAALRTYLDSATQTQLAPITCEHLWRFAKAASKPTKCPAYRTISTTRRVSVRYRATVPVKVSRRVKVRGIWVRKRVTVRRVVWKTRIENRTQSVPTEIDPVPCYRPSVGSDVSVGPHDPAYQSYVFAIQALAHEASHLEDLAAGKPVLTTPAVFESRAECLGLQRIARVASALGAADDDARSIAQYYVETEYPRRQSATPSYWSAECRPGGALDLGPGTPDWPTG